MQQVVDLKQELKSLGLPCKGKKAELVAALKEAWGNDKASFSLAAQPCHAWHAVCAGCLVVCTHNMRAPVAPLACAAATQHDSPPRPTHMFALGILPHTCVLAYCLLLFFGCSFLFRIPRWALKATTAPDTDDTEPSNEVRNPAAKATDAM